MKGKNDAIANSLSISPDFCCVCRNMKMLCSSSVCLGMKYAVCLSVGCVKLSVGRTATESLNSKTQHTIFLSYKCHDVFHHGGAVAEWVRGLAWTGDRTVPAGFESHCGNNNNNGRNGSFLGGWLPLVSMPV